MPRPRKINPKALYFSQRQTDVMELIEAYPVTVFSAPTGFGKTTFLREYAHRSRRKVLWHTVHCADPDVLWREVCASLSEADPDFDGTIFGQSFPRTAEEESSFFAQLRKVLAKGFDIVLVLDRFEQIEDRAVSELILKIAQETDGKLHIILSGRRIVWNSRSLPVLKGIVAPFFISFFIQTEEDIQGYFKKCGIDIPRDRAEHLYDSTGGWFALLQIFVFRYMEVGVSGVSGDLSDVIRQLIAESPDSIDSDLMRQAAMDAEFTREELEFLACRKLSDQEFDQFIRANSFVYFNYETGRYHMHRVLRSYYQELFAGLPEEEQQRQYSRLSGWYQEKGPLYLAMKYAFLAKDYERLMELTVRAGQMGSRYENAAAVRQYFTECPEEVLLRYPRAILNYLERFYGYGNQELAEEALRMLDKSLEQGSLTTQERFDLLYRKELCLAMGAFNDIEEMIAHYNAAGQFVDQAKRKRRISLSSVTGSTVILPLFYKGGSMEETCRQIGRLEEACNATSDNSFLGFGHLAAAEAAYFSCEYSRAKILVEQALLECRGQEQWSTELCALHLKVKLSISEGNIEDAQEYLVRMRSIVNDYCERDTQLARVVDLCECFFNIKMNREWDTAPWLREGRFFSEEILPSAVATVYCTYQGLLLALGRYATVISMDEMLRNTTEKTLDVVRMIYSHIHAAAAYDALGFKKDAAERMKEAMNLALPYRIYAPFVENSKITGGILDGIREKDPGLLAELEPVIEDYDHSLRRGNAVYNGPQVVDLTKREYRIAGMAAAGATNKEIAEEIHLSVNTIKDALKVIFRKLDISSRRNLAEKLKEIRIEEEM